MVLISKQGRRRNARQVLSRFLLRLDAELHVSLREEARKAGLSLNEYCVRRLASPRGGAGPEASAAVAAAATLLGEDLIGLVAFGSWARGELADRSDVDVLVVVEDRVALTRDLYRRWDASGVHWDGRPVDAHFVHLPAMDVTVSGVWAEAAIEGIVLFERGTRLSRRLVQVRRDVAAGRIARRQAHGQPYWVEVT